ncbi:MAG: energy transducer TonB [Hyphomonadaceae bacterium]|nr:energy transducer TonB [Hyphomonadaceae bacterium]
MRILLAFCLFVLAIASDFDGHAQELDVTDIVTANDAFSAARSKTTRDALMGALSDYSGDATVESVNAYVTLLLHDGTGESSEDLYQSATAATAHFEPVADIIPKQYLEARLLAAIAQFNINQVPEAMIEMAHVEGRARAYEDEIGERPDWAKTLEWKADAWGMAMDAYFDSAREDHPDESEIQAILAGYNADVASRNARADRSLDERGLPFCAGRMIQRPKMRYPAGYANRGRFGAVILELDLDSEGQVINPRVRASVPEGVFDEKSLRVVGKWKFKPDDRRAVGVSCRLERANLVQPLTFALD